MPDAPSTQNDLLAVGEKALAFRRYVLRRAYGNYYAIWACAISLYFILPFALYVEFGTSLVVASTAASLSIAIGLVATMAATRGFRKNARAAALDRTLHRRRRHQTSRLTWLVMWIAFAGFWGAVLLLPGRASASVAAGLLLLMDALVYQWLRGSFREGIPPEGTLAVASYGAGAVSSFLIVLAGGYSPAAGIPWAFVVASWLFAAMYAFKRAPEELVGLLY